MESRFSKLKLLIGRANFEKLKRSKVAVVGMGGVGSYAAEALARAGIGNLLLIDFDDICITNVNRQIHALDNTVGMSKVEVMRDRILLINPEIKIEILKEQYTEENSSIIQSNLDYLVDAIDDVNNKVHLLSFCFRNQIPVISSMGTAGKLDPTLFRVDDIANTSVCPLARTVRQKIKKLGIHKGIKVVYSTEVPLNKRTVCGLEEQDLRHANKGTISFVPPAAGLVAASVVVNDIINS